MSFTLALLRSTASVGVDSKEALLQCDHLTPSPPSHSHAVNTFRNECRTNLLSNLISLETKYNKCFILLEFVDGGKVAGMWNAAGSVHLHLLNV